MVTKAAFYLPSPGPINAPQASANFPPPTPFTASASASAYIFGVSVSDGTALAWANTVSIAIRCQACSLKAAFSLHIQHREIYYFITYRFVDFCSIQPYAGFSHSSLQSFQYTCKLVITLQFLKFVEVPLKTLLRVLNLPPRPRPEAGSRNLGRVFLKCFRIVD